MRITIDLPEDTLEAAREVLGELLDEHGDTLDGADAAEDFLNAVADAVEDAEAGISDDTDGDDELSTEGA